MKISEVERRRHARYPVNRSVKVRLPHSGRYWSGRTQNMSAGGAMILLTYPAILKTGERLKVGIVEHDHQPIISAEQMFDASVVRNLGHDGTQHVAIHFEPTKTMRAAV